MHSRFSPCKQLLLAFCLTLFSLSACRAEVTRLCLVTGPPESAYSLARKVEVRFCNGQELQAQNYAGLDARENYAVVPNPEGGILLLRLNVPVMGVSDTFESQHFVNFFSLSGQTSATSTETQQEWTILAKNVHAMQNPWVDPRVKE